MQAAGSYMVLHVDIFVSSMARALEFYRDGMGFTVTDETVLRGAVARCISNGLYDEVKLALLRSSPMGAMIELLELRSETASVPAAQPRSLPAGIVSILVPDLDAHIQNATSKGLHPVSEVISVTLPRGGDSRLVFYKDPDANLLEFVQRSVTNRRMPGTPVTAAKSG